MNRTQKANGLPVDRRDTVSAPLLDSARRDVEMALDALSSEAINSGGVWVLRFHVGFLARTIFTVKRTMFLTPIFFAPIPHPTRSKGAAEMTTEFKGTPGKWIVAYDDHNGQAVVSGEHTEVATCWHHSVGSIEKQMRANARLIASAPDFLAFAQMILEESEFRYQRDAARDLIEKVLSA